MTTCSGDIADTAGTSGDIADTAGTSGDIADTAGTSGDIADTAGTVSLYSMSPGTTPMRTYKELAGPSHQCLVVGGSLVSSTGCVILVQVGTRVLQRFITVISVIVTHDSNPDLYTPTRPVIHPSRCYMEQAGTHCDTLLSLVLQVREREREFPCHCPVKSWGLWLYSEELGPVAVLVCHCPVKSWGLWLYSCVTGPAPYISHQHRVDCHVSVPQDTIFSQYSSLLLMETITLGRAYPVYSSTCCHGNKPTMLPWKQAHNVAMETSPQCCYDYNLFKQGRVTTEHSETVEDCVSKSRKLSIDGDGDDPSAQWGKHQVEYVKPVKISPLPLHEQDLLYGSDQWTPSGTGTSDRSTNTATRIPPLRHHSGHFRHKMAELWDPHPQYEFTAFGRQLHLLLERDSSFVAPDLQVTLQTTLQTPGSRGTSAESSSSGDHITSRNSSGRKYLPCEERAEFLDLFTSSHGVMVLEQTRVCLQTLVWAITMFTLVLRKILERVYPHLHGGRVERNSKNHLSTPHWDSNQHHIVENETDALSTCPHVRDHIVTHVWHNFTTREHPGLKPDGCFYRGRVKGDLQSTVAVNLCHGMVSRQHSAGVREDTLLLTTISVRLFVFSPVYILQDNNSVSFIKILKFEASFTKQQTVYADRHDKITRVIMMERVKEDDQHYDGEGLILQNVALSPLLLDSASKTYVDQMPYHCFV
uniref:Peptidase M12B propeptide domain-containing protein n=1 Tax=Timema monikensis TaxID=170555 RepID=A0A7R9HR32_9NEOP|nr:unnamed protein product [Timema monikensis]